MYNYKIKMIKKATACQISDENAFDIVEDYWCALNNNGQVIGGFDVFLDNGSIYLTTVLPTKESLSDKLNNDYVKERLEELRDFFDIELMQEGVNLEYNTSCVCKKPSWYFLYGENNGENPLACGDCHKSIPLHGVPYIFGEKEHFSLLAWWRAKNAMDTLWHHGLWDRFTYEQTALHNSKLNREGRKISKALEKVLNAPVYYFIYYFCEDCDEGEHCIIPKGLPNKIPTVCPQCGGKWIDDNEFCKCVKCRLITDSPQWKNERSLL